MLTLRSLMHLSLK